MKTFLTCLIFTLFTCSSLALQAQVFPSEIWHQGKVVLVNDDTLSGLIKYSFVNDAIQLKLEEEEKVLAFSAQKLFYFEIYDTGIKSYRQFYSLPYQVKADYTLPMLFEVLYEGRLTLLSREKLIPEGSARELADLGPLPSDGRLVLSFDFFFLEKDGTMQLYEPKKRFLLSVMDRKYNEVKKYIRKNNLRHDHIRDLVRITAYYNALD